MRSSANRLKCTMSSVAQLANSMTKSRSETLNWIWDIWQKVQVRHLGRDRTNAFFGFFCFFELNFGHLANVGVGHLGRDRKQRFWAFLLFELETESTELRVGRVKPRFLASFFRSIPKGLPARAPEPSGHSFIRSAACASLSPSRFQAHACESNQCDQRIGCADWRCVYLGCKDGV